MFADLFSHRPNPTSVTRRSYHPSLESLEDRVTPATAFNPALAFQQFATALTADFNAMMRFEANNMAQFQSLSQALFSELAALDQFFMSMHPPMVAFMPMFHSMPMMSMM